MNVGGDFRTILATVLLSFGVVVIFPHIIYMALILLCFGLRSRKKYNYDAAKFCFNFIELGKVLGFHAHVPCSLYLVLEDKVLGCFNLTEMAKYCLKRLSMHDIYGINVKNFHADNGIFHVNVLISVFVKLGHMVW